MIRAEKKLVLWLAVFMAAIAVSKAQIDKKFIWRYPLLNELVVTEHYMEDLSALFLGAHRLAADLAYIQFLQYYGVPEVPNGEKDQGHGTPGHQHVELGEGNYPLLKEKSTRYLRLDPFFSKGILEAGGALAFNQKRIDEALNYLHEAVRRNPSYFRYQLYISAILFKSEGREDRLIDTLLDAIQDPDCPVILELVLGNLLKKYGRYEEAAWVYLHTAETAATPEDRHMAVERLEMLVRDHPAAGKFIGN